MISGPSSPMSGTWEGGCHLDTNYLLVVSLSTLAGRVRLVISRLVLIFCSTTRFCMVGFVWSGLCIFLLLYMELRLLCLLLTAFRKLQSSIHVPVVFGLVVSLLAGVGAVLGLLDGPSGCDPAFCVV